MRPTVIALKMGVVNGQTVQTGGYYFPGRSGPVPATNFWDGSSSTVVASTE